MRILIVDDDPGMAETFGDILEAKGHHVRITSNGVQALACIGEEAFDVTFLDIKMAGMNGVEVLQRIKRARPAALVVMMTAYALPDLIAQAEREGAVAVLAKPLPLDRVIRFLTELLPRRPVLVVEDDPSFGQTLQDILERSGYSVTQTSDAVRVSAMLREAHPDVVLLDLKLPGHNGCEVLREIRSRDADVPVILMTGYGQELKTLVEQGLRDGARLCLHKPFSPADLLRHLTDVRTERAGNQLRG
jgi:CheY-like chemotaxis protein